MIQRFLIISLLCLAPRAWACESATGEQVKEWLTKNPRQEVVFFASWCASCKSHMEEAKAAETVVIAVFDEKASAVKAYDAILSNKETRPACFFDKDGSVAKTFKVDGLPKRIKL